MRRYAKLTDTDIKSGVTPTRRTEPSTFPHSSASIIELALSEPWLCSTTMTATIDTDGVSSEIIEECQPIAEIIDKLTSEVSALSERVEEQDDELDELHSRCDELEEELAEHKDHTGREFADVRGRITEVENREVEGSSGHETPGVDEGETGSQHVQTPLERICQLPEHMAEGELSANQKRARSIAKDISDYADKAPAGLVMDSRTVKKVIAATEEKRPHTQTVSRVMDFLNELGKDGVELTKRHGQKLVVIEEEMADRLDHARCDQESRPAPSASVMS